METTVSTLSKTSGKRRSRFVRSKTPPGMVLMPRDLELLASLGQFRRLTTRQIKTVVLFGSFQTASYRLNRLWQHGYVDRDFRPVALGGAPAVYRLAPRGIRALTAHRGDLVPDHLSPGASRDPLFLEHTLAVNDSLIALVTAARKVGVVLSWSFPPKSLARLPDPLKDTTELPVMPDAEISYETDGRKRQAFLEVDRGTEPTSRFSGKVRGYLAYLASGDYERRYGLPRFRLLVVVPSVRRRESLAAAVGKSVEDAAPRLGRDPSGFLTQVGYAVASELRPDTASGNVWLCQGRQVSLFGTGGG